MLSGKSFVRENEDIDCAFLQCLVQRKSVAEITLSLHLPFLLCGVRLKQGEEGSSGIQDSIHKKLSWPACWFGLLPSQHPFQCGREFHGLLLGIFLDRCFWLTVYLGGLFWECNSGSVSCKPFFSLHRFLVFSWCLLTALDTLGLL